MPAGGGGGVGGPPRTTRGGGAGGGGFAEVSRPPGGLGGVDPPATPPGPEKGRGGRECVENSTNAARSSPAMPRAFGPPAAPGTISMSEATSPSARMRSSARFPARIVRRDCTSVLSRDVLQTLFPAPPSLRRIPQPHLRLAH